MISGIGITQIGGRPADAAGPLLVVGVGAPVEAVGQQEHFKCLAGVPAAAGGEQVEGAVIDP